MVYLILLITIFTSWQVSAQEKVIVSGGFGFPELFHIGVRYPLKQWQFGISFGSIPVKDETILSISSDIFYHFGGISRSSGRHPWYARLGLNYLRDESESLIDQYGYFVFRVGRDIPISRNIDIGIDAGVMVQLFKKEIEKKSQSHWLDLNFPILPSFGITLFYRIF